MNDILNQLASVLRTDPMIVHLLLLQAFMVISSLVFRHMRRGYYVEQANLDRKMAILATAVHNATGMHIYSCSPDWDDGYMTPCKFRRDNGDIIPGGVQADEEGRLRVYEKTGASHWASDSGYRFLGESEYHEIWKKPSKRRF